MATCRNSNGSSWQALSSGSAVVQLKIVRLFAVGFQLFFFSVLTLRHRSMNRIDFQRDKAPNIMSLFDITNSICGQLVTVRSIFRVDVFISAETTSTNNWPLSIR